MMSPAPHSTDPCCLLHGGNTARGSRPETEKVLYGAEKSCTPKYSTAKSMPGYSWDHNNNNNNILFYSANIQFNKNLFSALYKKKCVQHVLTRTFKLKITYIITIDI